ncbi:hypothetical protein ACWGJ2_25685 [Streptomyces sp. NPDC054796]
MCPRSVSEETPVPAAGNTRVELPVPPVLCPFPLSYDEEAARRADEGILAWAGSLGLPPERRTELAGLCPHCRDGGSAR